MIRQCRSFVRVIAIPLAVGVLLALSVLIDLRGPVFALLLNVFLLVEMAGLIQAVPLTLPTGFFRPTRFERRWVYERLGVLAFKRLMRTRVYRRVNPDFRLKNGRRGLADLSRTLQAAEAAHALLFVVVSAITGVALALGWFDTAAWLTLFNVLINGYPVMLQRYNRLRLEPLLKGLAAARPA
jgi:hypothetical protein